MASTAVNGAHEPASVSDTALPAAANNIPVGGAISSEKKRKREDSYGGSDAQGDSSSATLDQTQRDVLDILRRYDTTPSTLTHPFGEAHSSRSKDPAQKRAKLTSSSDEGGHIASRLEQCAYASLRDIIEDVRHVREEIVGQLQAQDKQRDGLSAARPSVETLKQIQKIQAFEDLIKSIVEQVEEHERNRHQSEVLANGHTTKSAQDVHQKGGTVLTLFGNAPTPKQLFSSLQASTRQPDTPIKSELPVDEMGLPTGLSATRIVPASSAIKHEPTFADAFPPPHNLAPLNPPKPHKRSTTRDTVINWEFKEPPRGSKRGGYTTQKIVSADWLGWGGVDVAEEPQSPNTKRKQRDRALSGGDREEKESSRESAEEALRKEEEALFRRAYSSFAPSHDNSKALVPAQTKSMLWWQRVGEQRYQDRFEVDPALLDEGSAYALSGPIVDGVELSEEDLGKAIEELDGDIAMEEDTKSDRTATEVVLLRITELIATLASHQRIRNSSLPSSTPASRTPMSPAPSTLPKPGSQSCPSEDETATYHSLRHELAYLILRLPPYAVTKSLSTQASTLLVNPLIPITLPDKKGTMEDDAVARLAKYQAATTAASIASLARPGSAQASAANQHYSTTANRTPAIGSAANTRYGQVQQSYSRTPATAPAYHRSVSGHSQQQNYGTPTAAARAPEQQYARPAAPQPPPPQPNYGSSATSQYYQQQRAQVQQAQQQQQTPSASYSQSYGQQYASTPQPQQPQRTSQPPPQYGGASSQPLAQYQARAQAQTQAQNAVNYQSNQAGYSRTSTPQQAAVPQQQPRSYQSTQQGQQQYGQHLAQYQQQQQQSQQYTQSQPASQQYGTPAPPTQYPQQHQHNYSQPQQQSSAQQYLAQHPQVQAQVGGGGSGRATPAYSQPGTPQPPGVNGAGYARPPPQAIASRGASGTPGPVGGGQ